MRSHRNPNLLLARKALAAVRSARHGWPMNSGLVTILLGCLLASGAAAQTIILDDFNSGTATGSVKAGTSWVGGNVVQNATTISVGGSAKDDNGWSKTGATINATGMNSILITAQRDAGNAAPSLVIEFRDTNLQVQIFTAPTSSFAVGSLTQVQIPITSWTSVDPTQITSWSLGGGTPPPGIAAFAMTFDNLAFSASAIPEPATVALLCGCGVLGFVLYRRRSGSGAR